MSKKLLTFFIAAISVLFFNLHGFGAKGSQPILNNKQLEHSLDVFSQKIISKNKAFNLQYKRYGKQAVLSFDMVKPNEVMLMLYLLEYNNGGWRISKEYHYTKTTVPAGAVTCMRNTNQRVITEECHNKNILPPADVMVCMSNSNQRLIGEEYQNKTNTVPAGVITCRSNTFQWVATPTGATDIPADLC